jgi:L-aspartate oxidase
MTVPNHDIGMVPVIIGAGLAGLMTALRLAPLPVVVLAKAPLGAETSSGWAQGGVAAAIGADDDPALHWADTLAAGDGLCDRDTAQRITAAAPSAIETLMRHGTRFDQSNGRLALGMEAAHSRHRIIHAGGDSTGREIMRARRCHDGSRQGDHGGIRPHHRDDCLQHRRHRRRSDFHRVAHP